MKGVYDKPINLRTICWQDEKFFRVDEEGNVQNDRVWIPVGSTKKEALEGDGGELLLKEKSQHNPGVMVSGGIHVARGPWPVLQQVPRGCKIDADAFVDMCMDHIGPSMGETPVVLIIDNAPSHRNKTMAAFIKDVWIPLGHEVLYQPPASPDLNCLDWLVWELLKKEVGGPFAPTAAGLALMKTRLVVAWEKLKHNPDLWGTIGAQFEKRLDACIKAAGGHFEPSM